MHFIKATQTIPDRPPYKVFFAIFLQKLSNGKLSKSSLADTECIGEYYDYFIEEKDMVDLMAN
jgi:hypothetical protein